MKNFLKVLLLIVFCNSTQAKPLFVKSKYLIATLYDAGTGVVSPGTGNYPLVYNPDRSEENALETDYWIISNINVNQYTFKNASTGKYLRYNSTAADRNALDFVDALQSDNSTSFTLELNQVNNICYYVIRSVLNTTKIWDRRVIQYSSVYPVGVYAGAGSNIEQFVFYDSSGNPVVDDGKKQVVKPKTTRSLGAFNNYLSSLSFNAKYPVVDTSKKEFYLSVPDSLMPSAQSMLVKYTAKTAGVSLYINGSLVNSNTVYNFGSISATQKYTLELKNGTTSLVTGTLYFSCLPLVQVYSDATIGTVNSLCRLAVTEPLKSDTTELILANMKIRGAYSALSSIPKKAYAINLRDTSGTGAADRSYFGLRNDNNWVLDAMYIDPGRMRNRVSTDLWNDFSTKPYWYSSEPKMRNGTRGRFVELFMNDAYVGVYCLTEKIDRKQLNLKKLSYSPDSTIITQRGAMFKADDWSIATLMGYGPINNYGGIPVYNNNTATWSLYECKYPDMDDDQPIDWKNLYNAVYATSYLNSDANFATQIPQLFDLPVYLDYYLFIELLLAADNQGKNTYLSIYDQTVSNRFSLTPWDLDATWGRRWDGSSNVTVANQDFDTFVINNEHGQSNLFLRLKSLNLNDYKNKLKIRYKELRGSYFTHASIMNRFQRYSDLYTKSGAAAREKSKWGIADISQELTFLSNWITARLNYLDIQYLGAAYSNTAVGDVWQASTISCSPNPVVDQTRLSGLQSGSLIELYSLQGSLLMKCKTEDSELVIDMSGFNPGVYILKAGSTSTRLIKK